jgi:hypothetical protein
MPHPHQHAAHVSFSAASFWTKWIARRHTHRTPGLELQPAGRVASVIAFQASLAHGLTMDSVVQLAGSRGCPADDANEWRWGDASGNEIIVAMRRGKLVRWASSREPHQDEGHGPYAQGNGYA